MTEITPLERRDLAVAESRDSLYVPDLTQSPSVVLRPVPYTKPPEPIRYKNNRSSIAVGTKDGPVYIQRFLLQGYMLNDQEQLQTIEHTEGWTAFFYGTKPTVWTFHGIVFDAHPPYDWSHDFLSFYRTHLRGSRIPNARYPAYVQFSGRLVTGYAFGLSMQARVPNEASPFFTLNLISSQDEPVTIIDNLHPDATFRSIEELTAAGIVPVGLQNQQVIGPLPPAALAP